MPPGGPLGRIYFHGLSGAGLTWAATQGATTRELMERAGHASPVAALRYQHAAEDRDAVIADAPSGLAESARRSSTLGPPAGYSRDDDESASTGQPAQPSWPARLKRAADQDRTGIVSLEGPPC